ncbi:MAG: isoleucine--tRNA ligase [Candidatus Omnitrophica bacterium]|nr:isoleucine--tRNA ligase [Candidatus Omnitrophota bacterium]
MDYQKTLNLPNTNFSMKAGLAEKEPAMLEKWNNEQLYQEIRKKCQGKKPFILHDGPPYANGNIHIGHALNKVLKDIIVKYRTMRDFDALYIPGWDCHGLPIEHQLLKEMNKHKGEVDCVDFRHKANEYAMKYVGIQRDQFKRLGIFGQWDNPYLTLKPDYEYWILNSLARLNKDGYIYRGLKPVNWCSSCETALAEAEVEYENHTSPSVYVKFSVKNPEAIGLKNQKVSLLIWTTTPWTLLANVAVAVHAKFDYVGAKVGDEILILEKNLSASIFAKAKIENFQIEKEFKGQDLTALKYEHPFGVKTNCCVVTVDYVTNEDGTGLVHTAPGHGQDDFQTGLKYNLDVLMPVDGRGIYTKEAGAFAGQHVFKANELVIKDLQDRGLLLLKENIPHSYPHCWRCKKPIIFRATKQWFMNIEHKNLRQRLKDTVINQVQWIPEAGRERILGMVTTRPDWCLSRQRVWGVPIPDVVCQSCGEHTLFTEVIEKFRDLAKEKGSDVWFEKDVQEFLPQNTKCPKCSGMEFTKGVDILDVWFDSGVSHQAVIKGMMGKDIPADLYLEGSDQHRGWFQSSIIPAVAMEGIAPYKAVLTHGFVVDGEGRKMSKSLGNVISPLDIIKNSGADVLRLWIASSLYSDDIRASKEILDRLVDAYRKIRNTLRYLLGNLDQFNPDTDIVPYSQLCDLDQWALTRLYAMMSRIQAHYESYEFSKVYQEIYHFCNEDLSSFYLDILKDRLYISSTRSLERRSAQTVLYHILNHLIRAMAPILTFTSEEIFSSMPKNAELKNTQSVHLLNWLKLPEEWKNDVASKRFEILIALRPFVLKALEDKRRENMIGSPLEAKIIFKTASDHDFNYLTKEVKDLPQMFIVSQVLVEKTGQVEKALSEQFAHTAIEIQKADGSKCSRCWNYRTDVGQNHEHPDLCNRCNTIVKEIVNA